MNGAELQSAAERLSRQPWKVSHDRHSAVGQLAKHLGVNTTEIFRWHRHDEVPEDAAKTILMMLEEEQTLAVEQIEDDGHLNMNGQRDQHGRLRPLHPNDLAIRLWTIDMAMQHLTRNQGILGLGANAVQQSMREEKDAIVAQLKALGEPMVAKG